MKDYKSESVRAYRAWDFWKKVNRGAAVVFVVTLIVGGICPDIVTDIVGLIIAVVFCGCPPLFLISLVFICHYDDKRQSIEANKNISFYLAKQGVPLSDIPAILDELHELGILRE
jgi:hypothetical protein